MSQFRITIMRIGRNSDDINEEIQWFSKSIGMFNERDKEKSCYRIFIQLLESAKNHRALTSDQIALRSNLSRGTVIHHINKLMDAGLVINEKNRYMLRVNNLQRLVDEIEDDIDKVLSDLRE